MRFLADENFPRVAPLALRAEGFDVDSVAENEPGLSDEHVLSKCVSTDRTLLTFDKDFGELAYRVGLPSDCGIVLFRVNPQDPADIGELALAAIRSQPTWAGYFTVVTPGKIRMRPIPAS